MNEPNRLDTALPRRLEKLLRDRSLRPLADVRTWLRQQRVLVNGRPLGGEALVFEDDAVMVDGRPLLRASAIVTLAFFKPRAVTSTLSDPRGKRDLSAFMAGMPSGVFPVGRLDRDTTGLLLFTNDGDLSSAITRPDHHAEKTYWLWLNECLKSNDPRVHALVTGVELSDGWARASRVTVEHACGDYAELQLVLGEGRNRQVRRMCRAVDLRLLHLHRRAVGPITLNGLEPGEFRILDEREVGQLWEAAGGRQALVHKKMQALAKTARRLRAARTPHLRLEAWLREQHVT